MPNVIIAGAQWGDEGKGKIVDYITEQTDIVVRAQGDDRLNYTQSAIRQGRKETRSCPSFRFQGP